MSTDTMPVTGRTGPVRIDLSSAMVAVSPGLDSTLSVEITNNDTVIHSLRVAVLGLDQQWVSIPDCDVALFPAERREVVVTFRLPDNFPSGVRHAAVEVRDLVGDLVPALIEFDLNVAPQEQFTLSIDPTTMTVGRKASLTATIRNDGNTQLDVVMGASDPEAILQPTFTPATVPVYPRTVAVARVDVAGKRPWMGAPQMRLLTVTATSGPHTTQATAAIMQRPVISRRMLTLLGMLCTVTVFTLVLAATFGNLARQSAANAELIKQSLGGNDPATAGSAATGVLGAVTSSTGEPLSGVTVALYEVAKGPALPQATTVTDSTGAFKFASVPASTYRMRFSAAGFTEVWYPTAATFDEGEDLVVTAGASLDGLTAQLVGQPASVTGVVRGPDLEGAVVVARIPAGDLPPVPDVAVELGVPTTGPIVQTVAVDAAGKFTFIGLPTPSNYELVAEKEGYASSVRTVSLAPGQALANIALDLVRGEGRLSGNVIDPSGQPVGGASVVVSDGTNVASTVTISSGADAGTFELRNLITPATYSVSITAPGYVTQNLTLRLETPDGVAPFTVGLQSSVGTVSGIVRRADANDAPFGGVTVTVTGPDFTRTTTSLTKGAIGTWKITGLPLPGTYTVAFSYDGYIKQARGVGLSPSNPANTAMNATLTTSRATLTGVVRETDGSTAEGIQVIVTGAGVTYTTYTSHSAPRGTFTLTNLEPGAYSITFRRAGSRDVVVAKNVRAGLNTLSDSVIEQAAGIYGKVTVNGTLTGNVKIRIYLLSEYPNNPHEVLTSPDGSYKYLVDITAVKTYLVEVLWGNTVVSQQPVVVGPGSPATGIDFAITPSA